jgi:tRNA (guanine-N7-)-methyltransferase
LSSDILGENGPLIVDIGSGKGRFLLAHAEAHPTAQFLGIERQYGRTYRTAKKAYNRGITNIKLARTQAEEGIAAMLHEHSVATFFIFFPDPWPKKRHHKRRLVNPEFLDLLHSKLKAVGIIHFATDHQDYADAVEQCFSADTRFSTIPAFQPTESERTDFELIFTNQNKPIRRLSIQKTQ